MPSGVFKPYAGVNTAIIIFTKTDNGGTDNVWFYDMLADGKSLDDKRNLLVNEDVFDAFSFGDTFAKEATDDQEDLHSKFNLPDILARYPKRNKDKRARTEQSFLVPFKEIEENDWDLSMNRYKEIIYNEIEYDTPSEILERITELDSERNNLRIQLSSKI